MIHLNNMAGRTRYLVLLFYLSEKIDFIFNIVNGEYFIRSEIMKGQYYGNKERFYSTQYN